MVSGEPSKGGMRPGPGREVQRGNFSGREKKMGGHVCGRTHGVVSEPGHGEKGHNKTNCEK